MSEKTDYDFHQRELDKIYQAIIDDPENEAFTKQGWVPVYSYSSRAKIAILGQAPGIRAQESRTPWNDPSGVRLREWLQMEPETFYDEEKIAIIPMDFYFPGKAKQGDKPPRKEFAAKWHPKIYEHMPDLELLLVIGAYAQKYYLAKDRERNLTETVRNYQNYLPAKFPLVHPSPLNIGWLKRNPWFEEEVVPALRQRVWEVLD